MTEPECECSVSRLRVNDGYPHDPLCPLGQWEYYETFTDEERGKDRNDAGYCAVCGADLTMWCDLVAHDQARGPAVWIDLAQRLPIVEVHPRHAGTMTLLASLSGISTPDDEARRD